MNGAGRRLRILTWHVHGAYLYYLSHVPHDFYLPVKPGRPEGYGGRSGWLPWTDNLHDVPAEEVRDLDVDCVLYQSRRNYTVDGFEILSERQRRLPSVYLEHDPPCEHPTDTKHVVDDPETLLVHVTHFNQLMWDSGRTPTAVVRHGVTVPEDLAYDGRLARGIAVVNDLPHRGRRLGLDVSQRAAAEVPLDLAGMASEQLGGLGELRGRALFEAEVQRRFFFNPIRYTSLGLSVCEAMMLGLPVVGLATTEMVGVVENGVSGYLFTDVERLIEAMRQLIQDPGEAERLSHGARAAARDLFDINRFVHEWLQVFALVTSSKAPAGSAA